MDIKQRLARMQEGIQVQDGFQWDEFAAVCRDGLARITELERLARMGREVVQDFMPNVGQCALQDHKRLNDFLVATANL